MHYNSYISYHSNDLERAKAISDALEQYDRNCNTGQKRPIFFPAPEPDSLEDSSARSEVELLARAQALSESDYLILIASPSAAASDRVKAEISQWLKSRNGLPENVVIILTEGDIEWDSASRDFVWEKTSALPEILRGKFKWPPAHLDFRQIKDWDAFPFTDDGFCEIFLALWGRLRVYTEEEYRSIRTGSSAPGPIRPEVPSPDSYKESGGSVTVPEEPSPDTRGAASDETEKPVYADENVQFTVFRPKVVKPARWYTLVASAHLSERRPDAPPDEPDPVEEVNEKANQLIGPDASKYQSLTEDSSQAVPRDGELTFVPEMPGVEFNPSYRSFRWVKDAHVETFELRASRQLEGKVAKGRMSVFLGSILLADINLTVRVDSRELADSHATKHETVTALPYRKIFASYSHKDQVIVGQFADYAKALGDDFLRDVTHLRAGEVWSEKLERLIDDANVFQLFWSSNSMTSPFVKQEWEYALSLRRQNFIRPIYWEEPLPSSSKDDLPPETLSRLQFQRFPPSTTPAPSGQGAGQEAAPVAKRDGGIQPMPPPYEMSVPDDGGVAVKPKRTGWLKVGSMLAVVVLGSFIGLQVFMMSGAMNTNSIENANTAADPYDPTDEVAWATFQKDKESIRAEAIRQGSEVGESDKDLYIWHKVEKELAPLKKKSKAAIKVDVDRGNVRIRGTVPDEASEKSAMKVTEKIKGVKSVSTDVQVKSSTKEGNKNTATRQPNKNIARQVLRYKLKRSNSQ